MTRQVCFQVYISRELSERIRKAAHAKELNMSEWARPLLVAACDNEDLVARQQGVDERTARQNVFVMVGVDALLAGHPDHGLRERAHRAYARKCRELGLAPASEKGGSDEA